MRHLCLPLLCMTLACEDGTDVLPRSPLDIEFTASALEVDPCGSVTLVWSAPGAEAETVDAGPVTLVSSSEPAGSVESPPICETTSFVLTASDAGGTRTASLTVRAKWGAPEIVEFFSEPPSASTGYEVWLHWTVANAARASLTSNGVQVLARDMTT